MTRMPNPQQIHLQHPSGLSLTMMDYGATWLSCRVPLKDGSMRETVLSSANALDNATQNTYMGAMIGRFANRIANATLHWQGQRIVLQKEAGQSHQLHGGPDGFNRRRWTISAHTASSATFTLHSPDGDQGFPGALTVTLTITLSEPQQICLEISATTDKHCPVCITHHPYFNLDVAHTDARAHSLQIDADSYLPINADLLPIGALAKADGAFNFREPQIIGARWMAGEQQALAGGYDHAFLLNTRSASNQPAARLTASDCKLQLCISTTLPALQLYTGQFLAGQTSRDGSPMNACAGIALEPQFLPDSPNHPEWPQPSCWLAPNAQYHHKICYDFIAL